MIRTLLGRLVLFVLLCVVGFASRAYAQTASTGALNGTVFDASHGVVPGANITVTNQSTGAVRTVVTGPDGTYLVPLLPPGSYRIEASHAGFKVVTYTNIHVSVTETATLEIHLQVGTTSEEVTVRAEASQLQTTSAALGSVVNERMVESLPLVTRNYTQILGLMPGVSGGANNAVEIGRGGSSLSVGASTYSIAGGSTTDNNFQMNGTQVNDLMGAGSLSGGVPVPNPDSIQEFKVQTGQYSAAFGRNAGANVDVITKSGTNQYHGNAWEYFRNTDLNANDFFLNRAGAPRGVLNQNQFGFTFGGPIVKKKALFFVSYQGTRQKDGLDPSSLTTGTLPVGLTNSASSRTAAALGAEFGGQAGIFGIPVASDGSNISPNALAVLNAQTSSGFVVPAPTDATTGATTYSIPSIYNDDQFIADLDLYQGQKSHLSGKFFFMDSNQTGSLPPNQLGQPAITVPGFSQGVPDGFRDFSLIHTYTFSSHLLNQAVLGFHRLSSGLQQAYPNVSYANSAGCGGSGPISLSSLCVPAPAFDNPYPSIVVIGGFNVGGNGQRLGIMAQNFYNFSDQVTYVRGKHTFYFGGGIDRSQVNFVGFGYFGALLFPTFPDFLEGNVYVSVDAPLIADRAWRVWDGSLYAEDDYQVLPGLTLNLGFRYEREGNIGDAMGRSAIFNPALANPNPPASGTLQGYVVASNYSGGAIPPGVTQASTNTAMDNANQNVWEPRLGFAWQLPGTNRMVLRGGYGFYAVRVTNQPYLQLLASWPWGSVREFVLPSSVSTALPPLAQPLPYFPPYSPTTQPPLTTTSFAADFRPPLVQQYSMGLQTELAPNWMLEVGYQGSRGTHLNLVRNFDQALSASPSNPIRGQTTNTLANVGLRVPIPGFSIPGSSIFESIGSSWYNALNASLTKRLSHGLQFQVAYTWASALENAPIYVQGANGGALIGNQNSLNSNYGYDGFVRPQRLVISYVYNLPGPTNLSSLMGRILGGWSVSGVTTFQSGQRMTLTDSNLLNAFGITSSGFGDGDRIQIASGCTYAKLATSGSVTSKLDNYFNTSCIGIPPTIGADGLAEGFGNGGNGIVRGPDQRVFDIAIAKQTPLGQSDVRNIEFRAEFFNAFNTPSFSNPVTGGNVVTLIPGTTTPVFVPSATFGQIQSTSVNPRIIQLALKLNF